MEKDILGTHTSVPTLPLVWQGGLTHLLYSPILVGEKAATVNTVYLSFAKADNQIALKDLFLHSE